MEQLVQDNCLDKVVLVKGCSTRHRSIYAGVKSLVKGEDKSSVVVIHDAVRPLIDETVVKKIVCYAKTYGASGVTRPLVSTVISADDDGLLKESLDRSQYCASEMPQGFQLNVIQTAYEMSDDNDFDYGTECLLLAMKYTGTRAKLFTGPDSLWKVTHRKDLYAAEAILKEQNISVQVIFSSCPEDQDMLNAVLSQFRNKMLVVKENESSGSVSCNSAVIIYSQITKSAISENTQRVLKPSIDTKVTLETLLKPCIIHVYNGKKLNNEDTFEYMRTIHDMTENFPDSLSFGILNFNIADYKKLSDMVTSLVWNRDSTLSGQTFVIDSNKNNKI
ncbi:D-ribitol-5-phosphate cytidylyltransferase-like [Ruditapes philippinarum]|uniref:D-ribitol-5-phosphate cytidylyltransferase-like n=1 Tax=Ruditapes philippinarum TaxID=129788 RepID=UPI00295B00D5|nr:D-ribitol-5-phosphate cytidylyltransferase-like [Ruditapes philippinarum]